MSPTGCPPPCGPAASRPSSWTCRTTARRSWGLELACADYLAEVPWILVERGGDICHELEEVGREYEADAIVVGSTHGIVGRIFGSVAGRLAKRRSGP